MINVDFLPVPIDVIIGFIFILFFGIVLGAIIYLPFAHKTSDLPLEKLSYDLVWQYTPDWIIIFFGCIIFLVMSFILISGIWRI
jgi:hypothetical protein